VSNTFQGVFLLWSSVPVAAAVAWWLLVRERPAGPGYQPISSGKVETAGGFGRVIRNRNLWLLLSLLLLNEFFMSTMMGWSPALLGMKGATPELAGVISSVIPWAAAPAVLFMPRLCDRVGLRKPFLWVPSIALAVAALVAINVDLAMAWLIMVVIGVSVPTRFITILTLVVELMPDRDVGTASGLVFTGYAGGVIGPYVAGRILDAGGAFGSALMVLVVVSVATALISLGLPETGHRIRSRQTNTGR
jgi:cyanate permease